MGLGLGQYSLGVDSCNFGVVAQGLLDVVVLTDVLQLVGLSAFLWVIDW